MKTYGAKVRRPCLKRGYATREEAEMALKVIHRRNAPGRPKEECRVYWCSEHQNWHLTSWPSHAEAANGAR